MLDKVAEGFGQKCHEVPVGFKYVSAKMAETGAIIGGESSGGLTVKGHIAGKDGIYAAALVTEMTAVTGKKLSALYDEICGQFGNWIYADGDIRVTPARKEELRMMIYEQGITPDTELVLNVEYPYSTGWKNLENSLQITYNYNSGLYLRFFFEALPLVLLFVLVCFFGIFFFFANLSS